MLIKLKQEKLNIDQEFKKWEEEFNRCYNKVSHDVISQGHSRLIISNCAKDKERVEKVPAGFLYKSPGIRKIYSNKKLLDSDYVICSGLYGTIDSDTILDYYQDNMHDFPKRYYDKIKRIVRFEEDLIKIIEQNKYKEVYFLLTDSWLNFIDFTSIKERCGNLTYKTFIPMSKLNDSNFIIPEEFEVVQVKEEYAPIFGAPIINLRYFITYDYLINKKDEDMNEFILRKICSK